MAQRLFGFWSKETSWGTSNWYYSLSLWTNENLWSCFISSIRM